MAASFSTAAARWRPGGSAGRSRHPRAALPGPRPAPSPRPRALLKGRGRCRGCRGEGSGQGSPKASSGSPRPRQHWDTGSGRRRTPGRREPAAGSDDISARTFLTTLAFPQGKRALKTVFFPRQR